MTNLGQQFKASTRSFRRIGRKPALLFTLLILAVWCVGQTSPAPPEDPGGVLHIRVKVKLGESTKGSPGLSRKRFFLIKGSLEQNKSLIEAMERQPLTTRDCYYARAGASKELIDWLRVNDCESVYCRELDAEDVEGPHVPREFTEALTAGEKTLGSRLLARKWISVNMPEKLRDGFYRERQNAIATIIKQAEASSGAKVLSVMTDRNGSAYFTDLEPGRYTLSNIVGTEIGPGISLWNCDVQITAEDLAAEKLYTISNRKDKLVKCVAVEKPLPACIP